MQWFSKIGKAGYITFESITIENIDMNGLV